MAASALAVANEFIHLANEQGGELTQMKLQKLLYFAQGWTLLITGEALIEEDFQAWKWGPVIPEVYHCVKKFRDNHIDEQIEQIGHGRDTLELIQRRLVLMTWEALKAKHPVVLSYETHEKGTPWHQVVTKHGGRVPLGASIPKHSIKRWFEENFQASP